MPAGSKPGEYRGGRQRGTPNIATAEVQAKLEALNCDPIGGMARIATAAEKRGDDELAGKMYRELAQYLYAKRKALEHSADHDGVLEIRWVNTLEETSNKDPLLSVS